MLTKNDRRVLDAVAASKDEWDGMAPHGSADWTGINRLWRMGLVSRAGDGACMTCPTMHDSPIFELTDAGMEMLREVVG